MQTAQGAMVRSGRTRTPIIAPAVRVSRAVKYQTLAASPTLGAGGKKSAPAAGLGRIRRLLGVIIQLAPLAFGGAQGFEVDADGFVTFTLLPVPNRDAGSAGEEESGEPPQSSATFLCAGTRAPWGHRGGTGSPYLSFACVSAAAFFAAVRSSAFSPACAFATAAVNLAFAVASAVSGIAPSPSF